MTKLKSLIYSTAVAAICATAVDVLACTSMVVGPEASASHRPMLWKHRDTSAAENFVYSVVATDSTYAFIGLYNAGDSLLRDVWAGINSAGFGIMNTASYNLLPDTCTFKDQEGVVMRLALNRCVTLDDFESLLNNLPRPLGVEANFGVIDSSGNAAYYEVSDAGVIKFDHSDSESGVLIRTNYSYSGEPNRGHGYIRHDNAARILKNRIEARNLVPSDFTETASRSFYTSFDSTDAMELELNWVKDDHYIPRYTSTATIVLTTEEDGRPVMWVGLGYPPIAVTRKAYIDSIPDQLLPLRKGWKSDDAHMALLKRNKLFSKKDRQGQRYINFKLLRKYISEGTKSGL